MSEGRKGNEGPVGGMWMADGRREISLAAADGIGVRRELTREELLEGTRKPVERRCGCTVNPATGERKYCAEHRARPKGQAMEAMQRAGALVDRGMLHGLSGLDWVTLRGYLEFAREQMAQVEELKRARKKAKARTPATGGD